MIYWSISYCDILLQVEILKSSENLKNIHKIHKIFKTFIVTQNHWGEVQQLLARYFVRTLLVLAMGMFHFSYWKTLLVINFCSMKILRFHKWDLKSAKLKFHQKCFFSSNIKLKCHKIKFLHQNGMYQYQQKHFKEIKRVQKDYIRARTVIYLYHFKCHYSL